MKAFKSSASTSTSFVKKDAKIFLPMNNNVKVLTKNIEVITKDPIAYL